MLFKMWLFQETQSIIKIIYTLKNKGSVLVFMVPWRIFKLHLIFPFHKSFFIWEKVSLDY